MPAWTRRTPALAVLLAVLMVALALGPAASAGTTADAARAAQLVGLVNRARATAGLAPLATDGALTAVATSWSRRMAAARTLAHNPSLGQQVRGWTTIGENVGNGSTVTALQDMFMASAPHRANILSSQYNRVGVGVVVDPSGSLWVTVDFLRAAGPVSQPGSGHASPAASSPPRAKAATRASRSASRTSPSSNRPRAAGSSSRPGSASRPAAHPGGSGHPSTKGATRAAAGSSLPAAGPQVTAGPPSTSTLRLANGRFNQLYHLRPVARAHR